MHLPTDSGISNRWRALWSASPQRSSFSRLDYVAAAAVAAGLGVHVHFVGEEGNERAGAAVTWRRRGPYREVVVPPLTPVSALLLRNVPGEADVHARSSPLDALLSGLDRDYDAVRLHLPGGLTDVRPALWSGWDVRPLYTYVLAMSGDAAGAWSESTARNFRGAADDFELIEGGDAAEAAVGLTAQSYERSGRRPPLSEGALRRFVSALQAAGTARAFGARSLETGDIDAAVVVVIEPRRAYYWLAGSRPGEAMTVLVGKMLPRLRRSGVELFDFVGANKPSLAEFKRRFGSRLQTYYRIEHYRRKDLKLLYTVRSIFR